MVSEDGKLNIINVYATVVKLTLQSVLKSLRSSVLKIELEMIVFAQQDFLKTKVNYVYHVNINVQNAKNNQISALFVQKIEYQVLNIFIFYFQLFY
jgi:hypothetical protein